MNWNGLHRVWVTRQCPTCGQDEEYARPLIEVAEDGGEDWERLLLLQDDEEVERQARQIRTDIVKATNDAQRLGEQGCRREFIESQLEFARRECGETLGKLLKFHDRFPAAERQPRSASNPKPGAEGAQPVEALPTPEDQAPGLLSGA